MTEQHQAAVRGALIRAKSRTTGGASIVDDGRRESALALALSRARPRCAMLDHVSMVPFGSGRQLVVRPPAWPTARLPAPGWRQTGTAARSLRRPIPRSAGCHAPPVLATIAPPSTARLHGRPAATHPGPGDRPAPSRAHRGPPSTRPSQRSPPGPASAPAHRPHLTARPHQRAPPSRPDHRRGRTDRPRAPPPTPDPRPASPAHRPSPTTRSTSTGNARADRPSTPPPAQATTRAHPRTGLTVTLLALQPPIRSEAKPLSAENKQTIRIRTRTRRPPSSQGSAGHHL
jgi:hypothetical protein